MACHDRFTSRAFKTMCFVNLTITLSAGMTYWLPTNSQSVIIEWIDGNLNKSDGNDNFNSTVEYQESDQALNIFALILGLQTWMSLFGAIPAMYISETKGPKFTITLAAVLQITFQTLTFLSLEVFDSLPTYFACQIIIGINLGIITTILPAYNSEISKLQDRAFFSSLFTFFLKFGGLLILFLGIEPVLGNRERVSYMYLVPVVPALIYLVFVFLVVESPAFYAKKRDFVKVREIVSKLYGNCEVEMDIDMDPLDPGQQDVSRTNVSTFQALKTYFTNKPLLRSTFYFSLVTTLSVFAAPNEVTRYSNRILASFGFSKLLNQLTTAGIFSFFVFVTIPASFLIDKWRRRVQLISNAVILGISMSVLTVLGQLDDQENLGVKWSVIVFMVVSLITYGVRG